MLPVNLQGGGQSQCLCRSPQRPGPGLQCHRGSRVVGTVGGVLELVLGHTLEEAVSEDGGRGEATVGS